MRPAAAAAFTPSPERASAKNRPAPRFRASGTGRGFAIAFIASCIVDKEGVYKTPTMRIAVIGGLDRAARELEEVARAAGHELDTHTGVIAGKATSTSLRALVIWSDLVLVLTDVNSHNAVRLARQVARAHHRPLRILRRLGPSHLAAYLQAMLAERPLLRVAA